MDRVWKAFEFSKRKFAETHGSELPVWALLSSGATGGVCVSSLLMSKDLSHSIAISQIAYWLSCYPLGAYSSCTLLNYSDIEVNAYQMS